MGNQDFNQNTPNAQNGEAKPLPLKDFLDGLTLNEKDDASHNLSSEAFPCGTISGEWGLRLIDSVQDLSQLAKDLELEQVITFLCSDKFCALGIPGHEEVIVTQAIDRSTLDQLLDNYSGLVITYDHRPHENQHQKSSNRVNLHESLTRLLPDLSGKTLSEMSEVILKSPLKLSSSEQDIESLHHQSEVIFKLYQRFEMSSCKDDLSLTEQERAELLKEIAEEKLLMLGNVSRYLELRAKEESLKGKG